MGSMSETDTAPIPAAPTRQGVSSGQWANYARRVDIMTSVIATILQMLSENPMIAPAVGPDFVREATNAADELMSLQHAAREQAGE